MLEKFLDYIRIEKRYSAHTITSYQKDLEDFASFVLETEATADLRGINKKVIRNFIVQLSENKLSKRSINRKLSSLRGFYVYLLRIGEITISPMESISSLKFYAEKQQAFSQDEMTMLQEKTENKSAMSLLEKLIIETLYQTGMRKAELCNLLFENVDFSKSEFKIIGKGNKQRVVPISERLHRDLQNYAEVRHPDEENKRYFFVNKKGKKLGERFVYSVVNNYLSLVTTKEKRSPHILRHSFATHVLNNGAEISKVKKILGHSSLASTQVYTEANIEELKKVFNKAHPRALKK
ncbi:tyrosine-type recombinase/integrase [Soonwooa sp.]|uniref:tyrosine-type recombinase/integrase n=1 Tax=Soonwooa sp. TaxID=1938592 RepID=UPI0035B0A330